MKHGGASRTFTGDALSTYMYLICFPLMVPYLHMHTYIPIHIMYVVPLRACTSTSTTEAVSLRPINMPGLIMVHKHVGGEYRYR